MIKGLVLCEVYLASVRAFPKEERSVLHLCLELWVFRYVDASVDCYFGLLAAFAAWGQCFVDD